MVLRLCCRCHLRLGDNEDYDGDWTDMSMLDKINTARTVQLLQHDLSRMMENFIFEPVDDITRARVKYTVDSYLRELESEKIIWRAKPTTTNHAVGYKVQTSKHSNECFYLLSDGGVHRIRKKFSGRRTARVFGKRNWKSWLACDITIQPITPLTEIQLTVLINNVEETALKESCYC